ncbi:hypothetical protein ACHAXM_001590 [Skeletonema potamos]
MSPNAVVEIPSVKSGDRHSGSDGLSIQPQSKAVYSFIVALVLFIQQKKSITCVVKTNEPVM